jgi:phospholipid/cholesterol/gamma-HCH transport system substrate-binding protein
MVTREVKVGVFVALSLLILAGTIFLIGSESNLFSPHTQMRTSFRDVQGLARGSPVRMGGVDIGRVVEVSYSEDPKNPAIVVKMLIQSGQVARIRGDSVASVGGRGMLGDKMIQITVGSPNTPVLPSSELIPSEESQDIMAIVGSMKSVADGIDRVVKNLEKTTGTLAEDEFRGDVKESVEHLNGVLGSLQGSEGYIGKLLNDPKEAKTLSETMQNLKHASAELELMLKSGRVLLAQAESGPGLVHELLYGQESEKAVAQLGGAAEQLGLALKGVREGDSFTHALLYDPESRRMVDNLNQATADFRDIARDVRAGKGTVGALLSDPSVYEDLKLLLGNVGRNRSLRALVRYSIHQDEEAGRVESAPSSSASPASPSSASPASLSTNEASSNVADLK